MIWPWLLFDYYHPKSPKSRFVQCFQWFCNHSEKTGNLVENRTILENAAFYQDAPENSDSVGRTFESRRAYHKNTHPQPGWGFLLPDTVRSLCPEGVNRVGRTKRMISCEIILFYSWESVLCVGIKCPTLPDGRCFLLPLFCFPAANHRYHSYPTSFFSNHLAVKNDSAGRLSLIYGWV